MPTHSLLILLTLLTLSAAGQNAPTLLEGENRLDMKIDLSDDDKNFIVRADIPGVKKEDVHVDLDGNRVSISAEIKSA